MVKYLILVCLCEVHNVPKETSITAKTLKIYQAAIDNKSTKTRNIQGKYKRIHVYSFYNILILAIYFIVKISLLKVLIIRKYLEINFM